MALRRSLLIALLGAYPQMIQAWTFEGIESEWVYFFKKIKLPNAGEKTTSADGKKEFFRDALLCNAGDALLLASIRREEPTHLLKSMNLRRIEKKEILSILKDRKKKDKKAELEALLVPQWKAILAEETPLEQTAKRDLILQINTAADGRTQRQDRPAPSCLSLLLAASLIDDFDVLYPFEGEKTLKPRRSARVLISRWQTEKKGEALVTIDAADGIFAQPMTSFKRLQEKIQLPLREPILPLPVPEQLRASLRAEKLAMNRSAPPRVVKIYGAWAYVDKGRGYGLKMNDRLIVSGDKGIEGHVVGYYGPEEKLKAEAGYPIQEGAIVFVRKGQAKIANGDSWEYDRKVYPQ